MYTYVSSSWFKLFEKDLRCLTFGGRSASLVNYFVDVLNQVVEGSSHISYSTRGHRDTRNGIHYCEKGDHASKVSNGRNVCRSQWNSVELVSYTPFFVNWYIPILISWLSCLSFSLTLSISLSSLFLKSLLGRVGSCRMRSQNAVDPKFFTAGALSTIFSSWIWLFETFCLLNCI